MVVKQKDIAEQKTRLEQKKNRLIAEEGRLRRKEQKMLTRNLIELGSLVIKSGLGALPVDTIYGALLSIKDDLDKDHTMQKKFAKLGKSVLEQEQKEKIAVILKIESVLNLETSSLIRNHGLKWNKLRQEWYGYVSDMDALKQSLKDIDHHLEIITD